MSDVSILIKLTVDANTRKITIPNNGTTFGVVGDIEINRVMFSVPRYYSGFDMKDFVARVNYINPNGELNFYESSDIAETEDTVTFTWLMGSDVTKYAGDVKFSIKLYKVSGNAYIKSFNTTTGVGKVLEGLDVEKQITPEQQTTLLSKLEEDIKASIDEYVNNQVTENIDTYINNNVQKKVDAVVQEEITELKKDSVVQQVETNKTDIAGIKNGIVVQQNTQPTADTTQIWVDTSDEEEIEVPDMIEFNALAEKTNSLKEDIVDLEISSNEYLISKNANLLNINDTGVEIGFYNTENGNFTSNDKALTSAFIPYDNNSTYSASYPTNWFNYIVSLWDGNKNFIKFSMADLPITKTGNYFTLQPTTYSNAKYIKFTIFDNNKDFTTAMVVKDMEYPSEYIPYGYHYSEKNNEHIADIFLQLPKPTIFDNKVLLFTGDSICYGANWRPDPEDWSNTGWRKIIQENYPKSITYGYGIGGTTISKRSDRTDSILERMTKMFSEHPEADYIIIEGGVNDAYNITDCPIGTISTGYTDELNENTFAGALESIFKYAQTNWMGKKIGYIVTFKVPSAMGQFKFNEYMDIAKQICEKWSVPYCDLYNESNLNYYIQEVSNAYGGGLHPNEAGYRIITNKIEKWLETL